MSTTKRKNASLTVPGPQPGGISTTVGPSVSRSSMTHAVDGVRVSGEEQRIGIEQLIEDDGLVALGRAQLGVAQAHRFDGSGGNEVEEDLDAAQEVEIVVDLLRRLGGGHAVDEVERPDAGLDRCRASGSSRGSCC